MKESAIWKNSVLLVHRVLGVKLFRNNVGQAWASPKSFVLKAGQVYRAKGGERVLPWPLPVKFGLFKGSGDGIGWRKITITQEMVGKDIAQFLSIETKTATGKPTPEQVIWKDNVNKDGGLAVIVRSPEEAESAVRQMDL